MCGRKRKAGKRERNGRLQRVPAPDRDVRSLVLRQPHRRLNGFNRNDPFLESELGRFVLKHGLDRLCYDVALSYGRLAGRVFSTRGANRPILGTRPETSTRPEI
jgi:hypothetical protein